jgi:hypothetical protein
MTPPYNWTQADVDDALNLINQSPLLVFQLLDIQSKSNNWAILIGNNQGDSTQQYAASRGKRTADLPAIYFD